MIKQLINMPMLNLNRIEYTDSTIWINASVKTKRSRCPYCETLSMKIHDQYIRTISDLPVFQYRTMILLKTRKFKMREHPVQTKSFLRTNPSDTEIFQENQQGIKDPGNLRH